MIDSVNTAFLQLQRAYAARSLYQADHPAVKASEEQAREEIGETLQARGAVTVMVVNGRVVWEDRPLPASQALGDELFRALRKCGADRITIRRGVEPSELGELLDFLAEESPLREMRPLRHIDLGHLRETEDAADAEALLRPSAESLEGVFDGVISDRGLDAEAIDAILISVGTAIAENRTALLPLLEIKRHDEYTFVHTTNVAVLSGAFAEVLGYGRDAVRDITTSALLHDVGKQLVPEEILNKKGRLSGAEMEVLRRHPLDGARMLLETPGVTRLAVNVAFEHHIPTYGGGYPEVPGGWKLGAASRIVQIADVFDALRTNRPYQKAHRPFRIRSIMRDRAGELFDPEMLDVFLDQVVGDPSGPPSPLPPPESEETDADSVPREEER